MLKGEDLWNYGNPEIQRHRMGTSDVTESVRAFSRLQKFINRLLFPTTSKRRLAVDTFEGSRLSRRGRIAGVPYGPNSVWPYRTADDLANDFLHVTFFPLFAMTVTMLRNQSLTLTKSFFTVDV